MCQPEKGQEGSEEETENENEVQWVEETDEDGVQDIFLAEARMAVDGPTEAWLAHSSYRHRNNY